MSKRNSKQKYKLPRYASRNPTDTYACVSSDVLHSTKFKALTPMQKIMYICCINQTSNRTALASLYAYYKETGIDPPANTEHSLFVFPAKHMKEYGIERGNGCRYLQALINAGFIEVVSNNKVRMKENIYRLSCMWQQQ